MGKPVSFGCIRMRSKDVIAFYELARIGMHVTITQKRIADLLLPEERACWRARIWFDEKNTAQNLSMFVILNVSTGALLAFWIYFVALIAGALLALIACRCVRARGCCSPPIWREISST